MSWFIVPIAGPAWLLEGIYRRLSRRFWEFNIWSGTFYILFLVVSAFTLLLSPSTLARFLGVYIFSALELLGLMICVGVAVGNLGGYRSLLQKLARRSPKSVITVEPTNWASLWSVITSYLYTAFYFGVISFFAYGFNNGLYSGVQAQSQFEILFDFIYFSYVSVVTLSYTNVIPVGLLSKLLYMIETGIGILYTLFIFSLIANSLADRRK